MKYMVIEEIYFSVLKNKQKKAGCCLSHALHPMQSKVHYLLAPAYIEWQTQKAVLMTWPLYNSARLLLRVIVNDFP